MLPATAEAGTVQCGTALLPEGAGISGTITATVVAGYTGTLENIHAIAVHNAGPSSAAGVRRV
ncbi:hypothetical protein AB0L64_39190 [Kribbella sp. NPDC051936]|uniref:hypothetical protein n=1 Tax=Kribbella sp. NPDC051936 TaxID=3154946 RepID=UPI00343C3295